MPELILASASPRRRELLAQIGIVPDVIEAADLEETVLSGELPRVHAARLAEEVAMVRARARKEAAARRFEIWNGMRKIDFDFWSKYRIERDSLYGEPEEAPGASEEATPRE